MTDSELGKLVNAAFDDGGFVETIRERLRTAVADVIGDGAVEATVRAGRRAADDLATLLVDQRSEAGRERSPRPAGVGAIGHESAASEDLELRARAFRAMAGVRV